MSKSAKVVLVVMAQASIEPTAKRKCEGPGCNAIISKWHKGRKVSRNKRFCSPRCQQRAVRAQTVF